MARSPGCSDASGGPIDPLARKERFSLDMATEWVPYQRLAAAVVLHAVTDRRETGRDSPERGRIDDFLFGRTPQAKVLRDHWFRQAGLPIPTHLMILTMIRLLGKNAEYRVIQRDAKHKR